MKLSITSTLLLALLLVVKVAHGCNDDSVGEYWAKKAIETLSGIKSNERRQNSGEYWGKKAIEALVGFKPNDVQKLNSIVKDFKFKPNQWQYLDTNPKSENGDTTSAYFVKDFVPKPNHVLQWHHGAASHDDDEIAPITYFVKDFEPKPNHVLQWHHGAANPTKDVWPTIKSAVTGFEFN